MSDREFRRWETYFAQRWNEPDRSDHYLMQIAQEIAISRLSKHVPLEDMKIPFGQEEAKDEIPVSEMTEEEIQAKAREVSEARRQMLIAQNKKVKRHGG